MIGGDYIRIKATFEVLHDLLRFTQTFHYLELDDSGVNKDKTFYISLK